MNQINFFLVQEVLESKAEASCRAVIIGVGTVGYKTAEFLKKKEKRVTLIEMLSKLAAEKDHQYEFYYHQRRGKGNYCTG